MIKIMFFMFLTFSILSVPMIVLYAKEDGLAGLNNYAKAQFSLGNFGFAKDVCYSMYLKLDFDTTLSCPDGTISELSNSGFIPSTYDRKDYCGSNLEEPLVKGCNGHFLEDKFKTDFKNWCVGSEKCTTPFKFGDYINPQAPANECNDEKALVYVQYFCKQPDTLRKKQEAVGIVCLGFFICCLYMLSLYYQKQASRLEYKMWDVNTVTAADFTTEAIISERMWEAFLERPEVQSSSEPKIKLFEQHLRDKVEEMVQQEQGVLTSATEEAGHSENLDVKISHITFAFDNVEMIKLLQARGLLITNAQKDKMVEIDQKIRDLRRNHQEKITRPVAAFITFETQEAYERACNLKGIKNWKNELVRSKVKLLGEPFAMQEAPEPTNIIWENRDKTVTQQLKRQIGVYIAISLFLAGAFTIFYLLKRQTISNYLKYPPTLNCKSIISMFPQKFNDPLFRQQAEIDKDYTMNKMGTGVYTCFCKNYPGSKSEVPFCDDYTKDWLTGLALSQVVSFSIVIVNFVLRTVNLLLIKLIGHHTESKQTVSIMTSIFVSSLLNTAILLLLANANTS